MEEMIVKYFDGLEVLVGDVVAMCEKTRGIVVCDVGAGIYTPNHPQDAWSYLQKGVMIEFVGMGLIYYSDEVEEDVTLIARKAP